MQAGDVVPEEQRESFGSFTETKGLLGPRCLPTEVKSSENTRRQVTLKQCLLEFPTGIFLFY